MYSTNTMTYRMYRPDDSPVITNDGQAITNDSSPATPPGANDDIYSSHLRRSSVSSASAIRPDPLWLHYFYTKCSLGEIWLCPITLECLFFQRVFRSPLFFVKHNFSYTAQLHLPYIVLPPQRTTGSGGLTAKKMIKHQTVNSDIIEDVAECTRAYLECCQTSSCGQQQEISSTAGKQSSAFNSSDATTEETAAAGYLEALEAALGSSDGKHNRPSKTNSVSKLAAPPPPDAVGLAAEALAYANMITAQMKPLLAYLLWVDEDTFHNFTRPTYVQSVPGLFAYVGAWQERRQAQLACVSASITSRTSVLWRLQMMFASLTSYLGADDLFSKAASPSFLDARAFAYLSILFSLPICCDDDVFSVIQTNRNLVDYCVRIEERYQLWDNKKCFLVGLRARKKQTLATSRLLLLSRSSMAKSFFCRGASRVRSFFLQAFSKILYGS
eukprot:GHVS01027969.1.p1 GENE.GHVS01027969.1~~GHVS01027969.1.p1  ORF type:complete len:442 (-),score=54.21 GHVS01027969.1:11-1336(-)